jgi:hypothetical protein
LNVRLRVVIANTHIFVGAIETLYR